MKRTDSLFAVSALFDSPDAIIRAAETVAGKGYTKFDVNTPYPVHGMDKAMKLPPTKLGYITLLFGLSGAGIALALMTYLLVYAYPMVIGGKPFFAFPAFVPVTFEVTVLLATLSTVIGMIAVFFKFPDNKHAIHDTSYIRSVSQDKYGIYIEADDPKFNRTEVDALFASLNASAVEDIFKPEEEKIPLFDKKFAYLLIGVIIVVSGGTYLTLNKLMYLPPFNWMMEQPRLDVQAETPFFPNGITMRTPVLGTVSRGNIPYIYKGIAPPPTPLANPLLPTDKVLAVGKAKFFTFCSPCHGYYGDGDSHLRGQFPNPPSLHSIKVRTWQDGNIYHVMVNGQNMMPSYESQLTVDERWSIIHYIRALQRAKNATDQDIQKISKESAANVAK